MQFTYHNNILYCCQKMPLIIHLAHTIITLIILLHTLKKIKSI